MNQKERAAILTQQLNGVVTAIAPIVRESVRQLRFVLDEAQNGPPHGQADGSMDAESWTRLRDYVGAVEHALQTLGAP